MRVKAKITVETLYVRVFGPLHTAFLTVILALTLYSGVVHKAEAVDKWRNTVYYEDPTSRVSAPPV